MEAISRLAGPVAGRFLVAAGTAIIAILLFAGPLPVHADSATATGTAIRAIEGSSFSGQVGTYSTDGTVTQVAISWGDGSSSSASFLNGIVYGNHTYSEEGSYATQVVVTLQWAHTYFYCGRRDSAGNCLSWVYYTVYSSGFASGYGRAGVGDAALSQQGANRTLTLTEESSVSGVVASFTDADPVGTASDYTATINWRDGHTSIGTVTANAGGWFDVSGINTYAEESSKTITVAISDAGGASVTIAASASGGDAALTQQGAQSEPDADRPVELQRRDRQLYRG